jgi:hypothetical protein
MRNPAARVETRFKGGLAVHAVHVSDRHGTSFCLRDERGVVAETTDHHAAERVADVWLFEERVRAARELLDAEVRS